MMMKKTAIITGGSRGIGYAVAKQLGLDGCQVAIFSLENPADCQEAFDIASRDDHACKVMLRG